jgi:SNF2 domain-containing protein
LDGSLKWVRYHGRKRRDTLQEIEDADIVLTTYNTLMAEFESKNSPLHKLVWFRLVLDEGIIYLLIQCNLINIIAHTIRRQTTKFYRAAAEIPAINRWCLTGTPIQNKLEDIGTLFAFIRLPPFNNLANFRRYISSMFDESDHHRHLLTKRLISLLQSTTLRRTKELLHLPDITDTPRTVEFSEDEWKQYYACKEAMNRRLRFAVDETGALSRFGLFQIQLQLRILCNHGTWQHHFHWARANRLDEQEDALASTNYAGETRCSACLQLVPLVDSSIYQGSQWNCSHVLCSDCLNEDTLNSAGISATQKCPQCVASGIFARSNGKVLDSYHTMSERYFQPQGYSSKMKALMSDLSKDIDVTKK